MNNKESFFSRKKNIFLGLFFGLIIPLMLVGIVFFGWSYYQSTIYSVKDNQTTNTRTYTNKVDLFSITYPNAYKIESSVQEGNTIVDLEKEQEWDQDGYNLSQGAWIRITYKKSIGALEDYVKKENEHYFDNPEEGEIKQIKINNNDAFRAIYGYKLPIGISSVDRIYIKNKNDVLELHFMFGNKITKAEYESYLEDFNSIVQSVKFQN